MSSFKGIEHKEQLMFYELNSQLELMDSLIKKIESNLCNCLDLRFLTAESALKIMHNEFLVMQNQILSSKNKVMLALYEIVEKKRKNHDN